MLPPTLSSNIGNSNLSSGINVSNLSTGVVSNAEFNCLSGVTSALQTQLSNRSLIGHIHSAYDITSWTIRRCFDFPNLQSFSIKLNMTLSAMTGAPLSAFVGINESR